MSEGQLKIPSHMTVLHVEQEVVGDDTRSGLLGLSLLIYSVADPGCLSPIRFFSTPDPGFASKNLYFNPQK
jgi:hypothetical protein